MARVYQETASVEWTTTVPLAAFWAYVDDPDAQVRYDARVLSVTVTEGMWGHVGSQMLIAYAALDGTLHSVTAELVAVNPPHEYSLRQELPDVVSTTTLSTQAVDGGTAVRHTITHTTRPANWLERAVLKSQRATRRAQLAAEAVASKRAVEEYYAARG